MLYSQAITVCLLALFLATVNSEIRRLGDTNSPPRYSSSNYGWTNESTWAEQRLQRVLNRFDNFEKLYQQHVQDGKAFNAFILKTVNRTYDQFLQDSEQIVAANSSSNEWFRSNSNNAITNGTKLRFSVSGKNLPDKDTGFGTTDGYFELYQSTDGGKTKTKLARSDTIADNENPDWGNIFEFNFDRSLNPSWLFKVYDEDNLREDDRVGSAWVNVADYVDKGQITNAKLDKEKGYLIIKSADRPSTGAAASAVGQIPFPPGTPDTQILKFKVSAFGLPTKDDIAFIPGNSDPYVMISTTDMITGRERDVGRSSTVGGTSNPAWGNIFQIQWDRKKDQRLRFKIKDEDHLREDDKLGVGWIELNDYVAKGQSYTLILPKQGSLTMSKA